MADRKEEIIQAGIEVFAARGYYNTHIAEIVEKVGIAKGTFYLYFNSKKDLFISLIKRHEEIFLKEFDNYIIDTDNMDLKIFFEKMLLRFFKLYKKHENLSIIILREAVAVNEEFEDQFKKMDAKRFQSLNNLHQFLIENNYITKNIDFNYFACTFVGIMESIVMRRLILNEKDFDIEEAADKISNYFYKAIS
ncbi:TetR family transcriptional regulator [Halanaerobium saccharolyticum]|uniref:TetR family transcriptional regulator n=1 Tax=Halanaerobium saccharolyticum TaxID=43595 RepID=A0A4V3G3Y2_9FIRM|nr:TetR/AcrR family transcriptional regulator [Halanaerobium saccharolyticum]RAK04880.1 TetR family transcriptional regulator [Halanaerobium saccharolyticum]TDV98277.1 TetR family transcriptional regulator [Halanaerobium saccharolyticum]TDX51124.1 TetR family transcriptional regulator [Halanaerobium saccharolyticum]